MSQWSQKWSAHAENPGNTGCRSNSLRPQIGGKQFSSHQVHISETCSSNNAGGHVNNQNCRCVLFGNECQTKATNAQSNVADSQTLTDTKVQGGQNGERQTQEINASEQQHIGDDMSIQIRCVQAKSVKADTDGDPSQGENSGLDKLAMSEHIPRVEFFFCCTLVGLIGQFGQRFADLIFIVT